jgi:anti-sigma B factor antagonist
MADTPLVTVKWGGRHSDVPIVAVVGEVDQLNADEVAEPLRVEIDKRPPLLVLDLTAVTFMSTTGLSRLIEARATAHDLDVRLVLAVNERPIGRLLAMTGLTALFTITGSVTEAIQ